MAAGAGFPGALIAAGHAQNGFVTGALLVGGVALLDRRPLASGALLGALIVKPHLALLVPFWLAAGGRWRAFAAAAASAAGLLALSWAVFGSATMAGYVSSLQASAAIMRAGNSEFFLKMATLYSQLRIYGGETVATAAAAAADSRHDRAGHARAGAASGKTGWRPARRCSRPPRSPRRTCSATTCRS